MGKPGSPPPKLDPHRRLPAEHAAVVAAKLGEMHGYLLRLVQRLADNGFCDGVETFDLVVQAHRAIGAAQRHLKDPYAEPGREPVHDWQI